MGAEADAVAGKRDGGARYYSILLFIKIIINNKNVALPTRPSLPAVKDGCGGEKVGSSAVNLLLVSPVAFARAFNLATPINLLTHYAKGTPSFFF